MQLQLGKITGFYTNDKSITVFERGFIPMYRYENPDGLKIRFNLPSGIFQTYNNLKQMEEPVKYKLPYLAAKERNYQTPPNLTIVFQPNPNKCSVYLDKGLIVMDNVYRDYPSYMVKYILFHEIGHYWYGGNGERSEKKCDTFAAYHMLKRGYNPSQVKLANGLTINSEFRKAACSHFLKKVK